MRTRPSGARMPATRWRQLSRRVGGPVAVMPAVQSLKRAIERHLDPDHTAAAEDELLAAGGMKGAVAKQHHVGLQPFVVLFQDCAQVR